MTNFHGNGKAPFFEGWYFKLQNGAQTLALIPGTSTDEDGSESAFVQAITDTGSCCFYFPMSRCVFPQKHRFCKIGDNIFGSKGIHLELANNKVKIQGTIRFGEFTTPAYPAMGPFSVLPFMQCNHGVVSLRHSLQGIIQINGRTLDFLGGTGYIEKDWGSSFPKEYLWVHSNHFLNAAASIMVSVADIPFLGFHFYGCIGMVYLNGREYRMATYTGVKILRCGSHGVTLKQGKHLLRIDVFPQSAHPLFSPQQGKMSGTIHESPSCRARFRFYESGRLLLDEVSTQTGFEFVTEEKNSQ